MKSTAGKANKLRNGSPDRKPCCGTLSQIAENRRPGKPAAVRLQRPPGELVRVPGKYTAVI